MNKLSNIPTLADKLNKYDKETLKMYAQHLDLTGLPKLKKAYLIQKIVDRFLDPEVMFYRAAILSDREIAALERALEAPVTYKDDKTDEIGILSEMDFIIADRDEYVVLSDVAAAWKKLRSEAFAGYQKRASWVWKCIEWAENMYAFTPMDVMLKVVNVKKHMNIDEAELRELFGHFPEDRLWTILDGDVFSNKIYFANEDARAYIREVQAGKAFYIPSADEVEEYYDTMALTSGKEYQDMLKFMVKDLGMDKDDAYETLLELYYVVSNEDNPNDAMQWFWDQFEFKDERQVNKVAKLYMAVANNTRMLNNRGNKPSELHAAAKLGPRNMPVITAGSSRAAEMLRQAAPDIEKLGFDIDLAENATTFPVIDYPNGLNNKPIVSEKKIYPNDPCPCGSGKKYKKCCGR